MKRALLFVLALCLLPVFAAQAEETGMTGLWYNSVIDARLELDADGYYVLSSGDLVTSGYYQFEAETLRFSGNGYEKEGWINEEKTIYFLEYRGSFMFVDPAKTSVTPYIFKAQDADLTFAPRAVIEPSAAPYNVGGWVSGETVIFPTYIDTPGYYNVKLEYSREGSDPIDLLMSTDNGVSIIATVDATETWDAYTTMEFGPVWLTPETGELVLSDANPVPEWVYVMNLRSVMLTPAG